MSNALVRRVGRLHRLAVFEAAARLGSFTKAARELGITQPGVTRQVRALEQALGMVLFDRLANRVVVNEAGRRLLAAVQDGFELIEGELARLSELGDRFVLAVNPGIAQRWLVPRLDSLQHAMSLAGDHADDHTELHLWLFDRDEGVLSGRYDAAIHLGPGPWPGLRSRSLFPEITVPVASPGLARRLGLSADTPAERLAELDLLHLDSEDRAWMNWNDWFTAQGIDLGRFHTTSRARISYNNYALVTQDALAGLGVALGWRFLVDDLLERELLVRVGREVANPGSSYQLLWPSQTPIECVDRLAAWLDDELALPVGAGGGPPAIDDQPS